MRLTELTARVPENPLKTLVPGEALNLTRAWAFGVQPLHREEYARPYAKEVHLRYAECENSCPAEKKFVHQSKPNLNNVVPCTL